MKGGYQRWKQRQQKRTRQHSSAMDVYENTLAKVVAASGDGHADQHGDCTDRDSAGGLVRQAPVSWLKRFIGTRTRNRKTGGDDLFFFVVTWVCGAPSTLH